MEVGFIGLGDQGAPMAQAIARNGYRLHLWARRPEVLLPFAAQGAVTHARPAALAAAVDHLGLCVLGEQDVVELLYEKAVLQALRPGALLAVHTTMSPGTSRDIAARAAARGTDFVDAPVSGGREGALAENLLVLAGATPEALDKARPVFSCFARETRLMGLPGAGQEAKILNNLLLNANLAAAHLVLGLGDALGIARADLRGALLEGTAASVALDWLERLIVPGRHPATLGRKDLALALDLAKEALALSPELQQLVQLSLRGRAMLAGDTDGAAAVHQTAK
jgi:3-hydroxyisobutyrate dehydrogenase